MKSDRKPREFTAKFIKKELDGSTAKYAARFEFDTECEFFPGEKIIFRELLPDDHVCEGVSQKLIDESCKNRKLAKQYQAIAEEMAEALEEISQAELGQILYEDGFTWAETKAKEALAKWEKIK